MAITITKSAKERITGILSKRQTPDDVLRVSIKGGGCSGFTYHYEFVSEPEEKDKVFNFGEVKICIDMKSYLFLNGMEIDYEETMMKSGIVMNNPNAKRTCGCGESVSF
jgi:iron-sulfur cluster assembly protein